MSLPHSEFLSWDEDDREALRTLKSWEGERCSGCGTHPSIIDPKRGGNRNAVVPEWKFCRVCELIGQAEKAGPPTKGPGWHLTLKHNH